MPWLRFWKSVLQVVTPTQEVSWDCSVCAHLEVDYEVRLVAIFNSGGPNGPDAADCLKRYAVIVWCGKLRTWSITDWPIIYQAKPTISL